MLPASSGRRHFYAPILRPIRSTSCAGSSGAGAIEVTFAEVRRHLGVETQRQWSDKAIARTTPALLGLYSLVALWANDADIRRFARPRRVGWYEKRTITFSDALAAVRRSLWARELSRGSAKTINIAKRQDELINRLTTALCYPA